MSHACRSVCRSVCRHFLWTLFLSCLGQNSIYEGYLESPCTWLLSLKRVYKTIIKYIFSERTILCRFVGTFLINLYVNDKDTDRLIQCHVRASDFSWGKNRVKFCCVYLKLRCLLNNNLIPKLICSLYQSDYVV